MADLVVTFCGARPEEGRSPSNSYQVVKLAGARTERIPIGSSSDAGDLTATEEQPYVMLYAEAACHVEVGDAPTAVAVASDATGTGLFMPANSYLHGYVERGHKVAVIEV